MRDTIKARYGYHVRKAVNIVTGEHCYRIDDGSEPIFAAQKQSYSDYQCNKEQNDMFEFCEIFTTVKGNQFIYWRDNELDEDYITKISE